MLQADLNILSEWCNTNKLYFNIDKCKVISFTRSRNPLLQVYRINNSQLCRVNDICDLGVIFDTTLSFNKHLINIISKSSSILGFITRNCKDFTNIDTLKTLFTLLVRTKLEYNSVVWCPYSKTQTQSLNNVQNRFLHFILFKCNIIREPHLSINHC